jgi:hypothetical protein
MSFRRRFLVGLNLNGNEGDKRWRVAEGRFPVPDQPPSFSDTRKLASTGHAQQSSASPPTRTVSLRTESEFAGFICLPRPV